VSEPGQLELSHWLERERPWLIKLRLLGFHLGCLLALIYPPDQQLLWISSAVYLIQMFGMEVGYHRYFSHRSFKTSRLFQLALALMAMSAGQRGVISWAATHRVHHKRSDTLLDPHSPVARSTWYAYFAWIWDERNLNPSPTLARDLIKTPELLALNRHHALYVYALLLGLYLTGERTALLGATGRGLELLIWGGLIPTLLSLHATMWVNAFAHRAGASAEDERADSSRNVWWIALVTLGAGWHRNHHRYPYLARAGLLWWQLDLSYLMLRLLQRLGLIWELRDQREAELRAP